MIRILLSTRLGERRWTQADLARATGIWPTTIKDGRGIQAPAILSYLRAIWKLKIEHPLGTDRLRNFVVVIFGKLSSLHPLVECLGR